MILFFVGFGFGICVGLFAAGRAERKALYSIKWITGYAKDWQPGLGQPTRDTCEIDRVLVEKALK